MTARVLVELQQAIADWPARAIHDTVAAIARQRAYARTLSESLLGRLLRFLTDEIHELLAFIRTTPGARPIVIAVMGIIVLAIAVRTLTTRRSRDAAHRTVSMGQRRGGTIGDAMARAVALAASGDHTEAAHALYAALIAGMAAYGWIRPHASKTSGDYARELLASDAPTYGLFRSFGRRFDRAIYGAGRCTSDDFAALMQDASMLLDGRAAA